GPPRRHVCGRAAGTPATRVGSSGSSPRARPLCLSFRLALCGKPAALLRDDAAERRLPKARRRVATDRTVVPDRPLLPPRLPGGVADRSREGPPLPVREGAARLHARPRPRGIAERDLVHARCAHAPADAAR